jgi:hypothetical protein
VQQVRGGVGQADGVVLELGIGQVFVMLLLQAAGLAFIAVAVAHARRLVEGVQRLYFTTTPAAFQ